MAGLVPAIHVFSRKSFEETNLSKKDVDARDKPGQDVETVRQNTARSAS